MSSQLFLRIIRFGLLLSSFLLLGLTLLLVYFEQRWDRFNIPQSTPAGAFVYGNIGTELAPLAVIEVLPELFPDAFHPIDRFLKQPNGTNGDWIDQFGFIRREFAPTSPADPNQDNNRLPVGFVVSRHRQGSGAPSPVSFVGLSCAACHSTEIRTDESVPGQVLYGVGNVSLNLLAFSEAIRFVIMAKVDPANPNSSYRLTLSRVVDAHRAKGRSLTLQEKSFIYLWIEAARKEVEDYLQVIDTPIEPDLFFSPRWIPAGPQRTQPFRSLVRIQLNYPGMSSQGSFPDHGFSKIPVVYHQDRQYHGIWSQFDGSVSDINVRSTLAASTAGANVHNLSLSDLSTNIKLAAEYTRHLSPPTWDSVFPGNPINKLQLERGHQIYKDHCYRCHGDRDPSSDRGWLPGQHGYFGEVIPLSVIQTDSERVSYRHPNEVIDKVKSNFSPENFGKIHPLEIKAGPDGIEPLQAKLGDEAGYYAGPISGTFIRAPYLHNASVLTLSELIGLNMRREQFYRGRNKFDVHNVGYWSPEFNAANTDSYGAIPIPFDKHYYFLFDTKQRGNSNKGHYYPSWGFRGAKSPLTDIERQDLLALLEYLKTL